MHALSQLRALSSSAAQNKDAIRERGAITAIVPLLSSATSLVRSAALSLVRSLSVNARNQVALAQSGAIPQLFGCLKIDEESLQANAAASLWNLASDAENKATIGDTGGVGLLLRLLQKTHSARVQSEVCGALRNLSFRYNNIQYFVAQEGGIETLADLLAQSDADTRTNIAMALNMCMQHARARKVLERHGCMPALLRALHEFGIDLTPESAKRMASVDWKHSSAAGAARRNSMAVPATARTPRKHRHSSDKPAEHEQLCSSLPTQSPLQAADVFGSIAWTGLELEECIGKGAFSEVFRARYNGFTVAAKLLNDAMPKDKEKRAQLLQECRILAALKHPNVVLLMGTSLSPGGKPVFVSELCSRGALKQVLPNERSMLRRLKFAKDIVAGLNWLHAHNIVHRDLKCANILVNEDYTAKISDLGLALIYFDGVQCHSFKGNLKYSAPEILRVRARKSHHKRYPYGPQTDVYSFALILWELVTREPLFQGIQGQKEITTFVSEGKRPPLVSGWPMSLQDMLTSCWNDNPSRRPRFTQIQRRFPAVMVDVMCPDPVGRSVCRELWAGAETRIVPYAEFEAAFQKITLIELASASLCYRRCLQRMLCDSYDHHVTFERVCNMVHTFGAMDPIQVFLNHIITLFEQPWFFGYVRVCDALLMLQEQWQLDKSSGYYMVRFSDSIPGAFSLFTIDARGSIMRWRIGHQYSSEYFVTIDDRDHVFPTLFALHDHCAKNANICGDKRVLPGSPFQCLFAANPLQDTSKTGATAP